MASVAGAAIGFAILSKGAAGLIPLIVVALAVAMISEFSSLGIGGFAIIVATATLVAAPWYLYEAVHNPLFWKTFIGHETLSRFATHLEDETKPADLHPVGVPEGNLLAAADRDSARRCSRRPMRARACRERSADSSRAEALDHLAGGRIRGGLRGANPSCHGMSCPR